MKFTHFLLPVLLLWLLACQDGQQAATDNRQVIVADSVTTMLTSGEATLQVVAETGARIVSLQLNGREVLQQQAPGLDNFGATFWPAPQKSWRWPPPAALHSQPFRAEQAGETLAFYGQTDPQTGWRLQKRISLAASNGFLIEYRLFNDTDSAMQVAPWEVMAVPEKGVAFYPFSGSEPLPISTLKPELSDGAAWYLARADTARKSRKLFQDGSEGWLACAWADGLLLVKTFEDIPAEQMAPGHGEVEVFHNPKTGYAELENQGGYRPLSPGDSLVYRVGWQVARLPADVEVAVGNPRLLEQARGLAAGLLLN